MRCLDWTVTISTSQILPSQRNSKLIVWEWSNQQHLHHEVEWTVEELCDFDSTRCWILWLWLPDFSFHSITATTHHRDNEHDIQRVLGHTQNYQQTMRREVRERSEWFEENLFEPCSESRICKGFCLFLSCNKSNIFWKRRRRRWRWDQQWDEREQNEEQDEEQKKMNKPRCKFANTDNLTRRWSETTRNIRIIHLLIEKSKDFSEDRFSIHSNNCATHRGIIPKELWFWITPPSFESLTEMSSHPCPNIEYVFPEPKEFQTVSQSVSQLFHQTKQEEKKEERKQKERNSTCLTISKNTTINSFHHIVDGIIT